MLPTLELLRTTRLFDGLKVSGLTPVLFVCLYVP